MAFELYNGNRHAVECSLHRPFGLIVIPSGGYAPTAEQEREGVTVDMFEGYVPGLLRPTPPEKRRGLLEEAGLGVPRELVAATSASAGSSASGEGRSGQAPTRACDGDRELTLHDRRTDPKAERSRKRIAARDRNGSQGNLQEYSPLEYARIVAVRLAKCRGSCSIDDIHFALTRERRSWSRFAKVAGNIFRGKDWVFTGEWVKSRRGRNRSRKVKLWRYVGL